MRRILHWHENFYPILGGGSSHIYNLMSSLNDFEYIILTDPIRNYPKIEKMLPYATVYRVPKNKISDVSKFINSKLTKWTCKLIDDLYSLNSKKIFLKKQKFELFHLHGIVFYKAFIRLDSVLKKMLGNMSVYRELVDFGFVKQPKLLTVHNFFPGFTNDENVVENYNHYLNQFDNVICVDRHIYYYVMNYYKKREKNEKKIWYIPNSVDTRKFYYSPIPKRSKLRIGFVGRLAKTVDLSMLNRLLLSLSPNMELYMAVTGDLGLLEVPKSRRSFVKIYKHVHQDLMPLFYHDVDVVINPVLHPAITRVTLEAMSCGRPVIMYNNGDRYPLEHGKTGFFIERDWKTLFSLLEKLQKDRSYIEYLGLNARKVVEEHFSNEVIMPQIKKIYLDLLS